MKRKKYEGRKKTSIPLIHVCVHSLRDNGCSLCDIEIASVKLTYPSIHEEERRVRGSPVGRVKHKSISLHSTARAEKRQPPTRTSRKHHGRWTFGERLYQYFCLHLEIFTPAIPVLSGMKSHRETKIRTFRAVAQKKETHVNTFFNTVSKRIRL